MGKKNDRINDLIDVLKSKNIISIKELAKLFNVSEMTIRRDLKVIEQNKIAENKDGLLIYNPAHTIIKIDGEYNLSSAEVMHDQEKIEIGKFAASLINENDIVMIDTGTTTEHIAQNIPENKNLTVLCYNINILMELRRKVGVQILFAGGYYHSNTQLFESPQGIQFIKSIRAHKVFISAAGVHNDLGITCVENYEIPTKQAIIKSALQKILVADSSKFGTIHSAYFCDLKDIDVIVTDNKLSDEWKTIIHNLGITLYIV
jgi:DeoR family deoxyribose operon repressor